MTIEASRGKYILAWVVSSAAATMVTFLPDLILSEYLAVVFGQYSVVLAAIIFNFVTGLLTVLTICFVYLLFRGVFIQKVMPYFWVLGGFGFLYTAGKSANELGLYYRDSGLIYVDLATQILGVLAIQHLYRKFFPSRYYPPSRYVHSAGRSGSSSSPNGSRTTPPPLNRSK